MSDDFNSYLHYTIPKSKKQDLLQKTDQLYIPQKRKCKKIKKTIDKQRAVCYNIFAVLKTAGLCAVKKHTANGKPPAEEWEIIGLFPRSVFERGFIFPLCFMTAKSIKEENQPNGKRKDTSAEAAVR